MRNEIQLRTRQAYLYYIEMAERINDKWTRSHELLARAKQSLAGGVSSPFRAKAPVPLYFEDATGCRLRDVDGNEYIDYALAWGPLILGHRHPAMVEALRNQVERPHLYGAQHELEFEVAEALQRAVPCAERVAFTSSGSEGVQIALRLARAYIGRPLVVKFEGHYHGWLDSVLISYHPEADRCGDPDRPNKVLGSRGQAANAADNVLVVPWNDVALIEEVFAERGKEIATVITEPVLCNSGCLLPEDGYLAALRRICSANGSLLIFDEVITGFRMDLRGAQGHYEVTPDLATFGKAIGGGVTLSALAGREDILDLMQNGGVAYGGTFNGNPLSLAGARATLGELSKNGGEPLRHANRMGELLQSRIRECARKHGVPLAITGFGAAFSMHFTRKANLKNYRDVLEDDSAMLRGFLLAALAEGLYLLPDGRIYVSVAHQRSDIE
ncbi:MAG: aspartate aminotransferase family protein, partial [Acidobacteriota bacterium]|nr:aspartate aminotransferase family protein [Acidobacteriota bacterium]